MNSRPRIAVVGASVRGAAFSLLRAGCEVVAADLFADADLQRVCPATRIANYPDDLADWLADTTCDGWLYTGALENHPELVDRMAELRPLLGNRADVLRLVRDPLVLQEVLNAANLSFPDTKPCDGSPAGEGEWLHKTGQGASGSGVQRAGGRLYPGHVPQGQAQRLASGYWQREIKGTPGSAQYIADGRATCKLLAVTRQDMLATAEVSAQRALQLHVAVLEELVQGLGTRSARHVMNRADLLALEVMGHLADGYRARLHDGRHPLRQQILPFAA